MQWNALSNRISYVQFWDVFQSWFITDYLRYMNKKNKNIFSKQPYAFRYPTQVCVSIESSHVTHNEPLNPNSCPWLLRHDPVISGSYCIIVSIHSRDLTSHLASVTFRLIIRLFFTLQHSVGTPFFCWFFLLIRLHNRLSISFGKVNTS